MLDAILNNVGAYTIVGALIAFGGAIGGAVALLITSRRSTYISSVTVERSKWIDKLRSELAEYTGLVDELRWDLDENGNEPGDDRLHRLRQLSALMKLQLNPDGAVDKNIIRLLGTTHMLLPFGKKETLHRAQTLFIAHSQWLLKDEWEVVKFEARGMWGRSLARIKRWKRSRRYAAWSSGGGNIDSLQNVVERIKAENKPEKELSEIGSVHRALGEVADK